MTRLRGLIQSRGRYEEPHRELHMMILMVILMLMVMVMIPLMMMVHDGDGDGDQIFLGKERIFFICSLPNVFRSLAPPCLDLLIARIGITFGGVLPS